MDDLLPEPVVEIVTPPRQSARTVFRLRLAKQSASAFQSVIAVALNLEGFGFVNANLSRSMAIVQFKERPEYARSWIARVADDIEDIGICCKDHR